MGLLGEEVLLPSHDSQPFFELFGAAPEARSQLGVELLGALPPALEQKCRKPVEPRQMFVREVAMLLREPFEPDFGFAAGTRRLLDGTKPFPVLRSHRGLELWPVRAELAPQSSDRDPEIMERLTVEAIVQPALGGTRRRQALEGEPSR
jgi:hypothetical protein